MTFNQIVLKNFFKNLNRYVLYLFSLIFSVTLFYSFMLLATNNLAQNEISSASGGTDAFIAGSIVILIIIITFVMFANHLFIKRRNKELALYKLIGMTDRKILRVLIIENIIIYFGSVVFGILLGLVFSRLLNMILFRMMGIDSAVDFQFSVESVLYTVVLFVVIFIILLIQNVIFIKRTKLITLMQLQGISEVKLTRPNIFTFILGALGFIMIASGYFLSERLFDIGSESPMLLLPLMLLVLFLTIVGAYFIFKFTVALVLNIYRRTKNGHVNVNDVLATSSIMFKMKSNAFLLTLITTITAISLTAMSLAYISYYSAEGMVESMNPYDYLFVTEDDTALDRVSDALTEEGVAHEAISYEFRTYELSEPPSADDEVVGQFSISVNTSQESTEYSSDVTDSGDAYGSRIMNVASEVHFSEFNIEDDTGVLTGNISVIDELMSYSDLEEVTFNGDDGFSMTIPITEKQEDAVVPSAVAYAQPTLIVSDDVYDTLVENMTNQLYFDTTLYAINVEEDNAEVFETVQEEVVQDVADGTYSYFQNTTQEKEYMKQMMGLTMFILGFIGLAFLVASGCILYFKQIAECDEERGNYTVLRKLGFTESEMLRGLVLKMLFSFGIPLLIGILHSVFAVRAGWFIFGNELLVPTVTVIIIYTVLYSIFGLFSLLYYRKVVRESL